MARIVLAVDKDVEGGLAAARRSANQLSYDLKEPVLVFEATADQIEEFRAAAAGEGNIVSQQGRAAAPAVSAAPMAPAPFLWRKDGRPDWGNMWQGFCELALFGGPPHRGEAQALRVSLQPPRDTMHSGAIEEIQRGIRETTGLTSEPAEQGWLAVQCDSPKMAAWLCATILLENVDAKCDGDRLFLPAAPSFVLTDQVKSVVTVLAKTHHYWRAHAAQPAAEAAGGRG